MFSLKAGSPNIALTPNPMGPSGGIINLNPTLTNLINVSIGGLNLFGASIAVTTPATDLYLTPPSGASVSLRGNGYVIPLKFYNAARTYYVGFQTTTLSGNTLWTLPPADGTANQALITNGSGILSWGPSGGVGTVTSISEGSNIVLSPNPITTTGSVALSNTPIGLTSIGVGSLSISGSTIDNPTDLAQIKITNSIVLAPDSTDPVFIGGGSGSVTPLAFNNAAGTFYSAFQAGTLTSSTLWTLPLTDGGNGDALITNGSGVLSWTPTAAGTVTSITQGTNMSFSVTPITTTGTINLASTLTGLTSVTVGNITLSSNTIATSSGSLILNEALNMNTHQINNLVDPTSPQDGATKSYVDSVASGLNPAESVVAASTANLTATYVNGVSGVGATLTNAGTMAAFSIDGQSPTINQRVLIKNQSSTFQNGIYTVTVVGSGALNWVLTRATDFDTPSNINSTGIIPVINGTVNGNTLWLSTATVTTVGTDPIIFTQFAAGTGGTVTSISQGTNMNLSPNPITTTGTVNLDSSLTGMVDIEVQTLNATAGNLAIGQGSLATNTVTIYGSTLTIGPVCNIVQPGITSGPSTILPTSSFFNTTMQGTLNINVASFLGTAGPTNIGSPVCPTYLNNDTRFTNGSFYNQFSASGALAANVSWLWPLTDSTGTQFLQSDGAGNLSWGTGASGTVTSISQGSNIVCTPNPITSTGTIALSATPSGLTSIGVGNYSIASNTITNTTGAIILAPHTTSAVQLNNGTNVTPLQFYNAAGTFYSALQAGNPSANVTWTLPLADGSANQFLKTNGSGVLSFAFDNTAIFTDLTNNNQWPIATAPTAPTLGTAIYNTAFGVGALTSLTTGYANTAFGGSALTANTTGIINTAIGFGALISNTTGQNNTAVGGGTLAANSTGGLNTGLGGDVLPYLTTGSFNTAVGYAAGGTYTHLVTGSENTLLGYGAGVNADPATNRIVIGYNAEGTADNTIQIGSVNMDFCHNVSALATSAAIGFTRIPSCAGVPTGTPASINSTIPVVYDSTDSVLYVYNSVWHAISGTGTVTSITQGTNMSFSSNPITTTGTINLASTVSGLTSLSTAALTAAGTVNINTTGSGVTTIGTGGTGAVNIGNAAGNTSITGALTVNAAGGSGLNLISNSSINNRYLSSYYSTIISGGYFGGLNYVAANNWTINSDGVNAYFATAELGSAGFNIYTKFFGGQTSNLTGQTNATITGYQALGVNASTSAVTTKNNTLDDGSGAMTIAGLSTLAALTQVGTANINTTGTAVATIGNASSTTNIGGPLNLKGTINILNVSPLLFYDTAGTNYVGFEAASSLSGNTTWRLPTTDGGAGEALVTNGSGVLSWSSTGVGSVTSITQGTNMSFSVTPITTTGTINLASTVSGLTSLGTAALTVTGLSTLGALTQAGTANINATGSAATNLGNNTGLLTQLGSTVSINQGTAGITNINTSGTGGVNIGNASSNSSLIINNTAQALNFGRGTVTQATSQTTPVTLNGLAGKITTFPFSGSFTNVSFTFNNSCISSTSNVLLSITSIAGAISGLTSASIIGTSITSGSMVLNLIVSATMSAVSFTISFLVC